MLHFNLLPCSSLDPNRRVSSSAVYLHAQLMSVEDTLSFSGSQWADGRVGTLDCFIIIGGRVQKVQFYIYRYAARATRWPSGWHSVNNLVS